MKRITIYIILLALASGMGIQARTAPEGKYLFLNQSRNGVTEIGAYAALTGSYFRKNGQPAGYLGGSAGLVINHHFTLGFAGKALWYDYPLTGILPEGSYHLEAAYGGICLEYLQPLGNSVKLGISLLAGRGIAQYRSDKDFSERYLKNDRIIQRSYFHAVEPGMELMVRISRSAWLGLSSSCLITSPLALEGTDPNFLKNLSYGVSIRIGIL